MTTIAHRSRSRTAVRTAPSAGTIAAFLLVLIFGSPPFVDWVNDNTSTDTAGGFLARTLAWPSWTFDSDLPARELLTRDLRAILVVVATALFLAVLTRAELSRARGTPAAFITGWAAFIFAGAVAGFVGALFAADAPLLTALQWAGDGAAYGLYTGWFVGFVQMGARRP